MSGEPAYSGAWFELFLERIPAEITRAQVAFLARQLPLPRFTRVLDVPCGRGRHARELAERGYAVTGVDSDAGALTAAAERAPTARFVQLDVRDLGRLGERFDAVLCLWASFGWFDDATNEQCFEKLALHLEPHGRLVLDVFHPHAFDAAPPEETRAIGGVAVTTRTRLAGRRVAVEIEYAGRTDRDRFEWRLYEPGELAALGARSGLTLRLACARFDEPTPPAANLRHAQYVFERA